MTKLPSEIVEWIKQEELTYSCICLGDITQDMLNDSAKLGFTDGATAMAHHLLDKPKADEQIAGREWWIDDFMGESYTKKPATLNETIHHVIEISALTALQEKYENTKIRADLNSKAFQSQLQIAQQLKTDALELVEVLEVAQKELTAININGRDEIAVLMTCKTMFDHALANWHSKHKKGGGK